MNGKRIEPPFGDDGGLLGEWPQAGEYWKDGTPAKPKAEANDSHLLDFERVPLGNKKSAARIEEGETNG